MVIESKIEVERSEDVFGSPLSINVSNVRLPFGCFNSLSLLKLENNSQCFSCLMWTIFIEQVMNVNEQQSQVIDLLSSPQRFWSMYEDFNEIQKIHKQRMIQLLQLLLPVEMLRIKSSDLLAFQWSDDCVVVCEVVAKNAKELKFSLYNKLN